MTVFIISYAAIKHHPDPAVKPAPRGAAVPNNPNAAENCAVT